MHIVWHAVGAIVQRVVVRRREGDPLEGLVTISVDELSYRRHHQYVTVVVDDVARRIIVWAREGKDTATLKAYTMAKPEKTKPERLGRRRSLICHV